MNMRYLPLNDVRHKLMKPANRLDRAVCGCSHFRAIRASRSITLSVMLNALSGQSDDYREFWSEYHLSTLTTLRPDGRPHVVPVGVTVDAVAGVARVITRKSSRKVANILAGGSEVRVAVCQVDGGRWATLEGVAEVCVDEAVVEDAVSRYGQRYGRTPAPDPERVVILISIERAMGQTFRAQPQTVQVAS
ncbi:pyridoxamine 5'-phosphate oxidase family protein [Streptomyces sp. NPDC087294]|uniref:pyridoxamine 5'-phosphate oxidase family protein n=1 Tax=Streptomyces sp. NPDC087294 TaxID=3365777 RepID=UPI00382F0B19